MAAGHTFQQPFWHDPVRDTLLALLVEEEMQAPGSDFALALKVAVVQREQSPFPVSRSDQPAIAPHKMRRAIQYLESHLCTQVRLQDIAAAAGLSRFHFCRQFRIATGLTPLQYVLQRRIERAKRKLRESDDAVVDIALDLGFASQGHFTTVFRKITGIPPGRFRNLLACADDHNPQQAGQAAHTM